MNVVYDVLTTVIYLALIPAALVLSRAINEERDRGDQ